MTANVLEHRRAKAFAEALEAHRTGQQAGSPALGELVATAQALGELSVPALDLEVRTTQRAQLMAAFEQAVAGGGLPSVPRQRRHRADRIAPRGRRWGRRFAIGGLVAGVTVGSLAGVAAASTGALPGETLYPVKRGLEDLRLDLARSDAERGALLLDQASNRLAEAHELVGRAGDGSALSPETVARLGAALKDMNVEAAKGGDLLRRVYQANGSLDPMRRLAAFTDRQDDHWAALQRELPPQLTPEAGQVDQLFDNFNAEVAPLHLDQGTGQGGSGAPAQAPGSPAVGSSSPTGGSASAVQSGGSPASSTGGQAGDAQPSDGSGTAQRQGQGPAAGSAGGAVGGPVGGLVNGLTGNLTGTAGGAGSSPAPAAGSPQNGPAAPAPGVPAGGAPAAGASPGASQNDPGLDLPPLVPGLLPGLGVIGGTGN
ncbi:DUF5667 domain-containing protein [Kitasatospora sp. NPDC052896]|uniref:DUF5667 domain-containing protein n=1 Tax=Kitasatospora sp. NPDC052896 TaxID=3364061 RepID=UPI0037C9AFBD